MGLVVALVHDRETRARIRQGLGASVEVMFCDKRGELPEILTRVSASVIITELWDASGATTAPVVRQLRAGFPSTPIIAYGWLTSSASRELLAIARAGVNGLILRGYDDVGAALRSALSEAQTNCIAALVRRELNGLVSDEARAIVDYCLEHAQQAIAVAQIGHALGTSRRTLANRMARAGLPAPSVVMTWARLLLAAHLMEDPKRSVECIALSLGFPTATALRNMLRRHTGLRPRDVRGGGGLQRLLPLFKERLRSR